MLIVITTKNFKKDYKKLAKSGKDISKLNDIMVKLANEEELPLKNKDHFLVGNYQKHKECHVDPDWLLIYYPTEETITFIRTGSHSELFE